LYVVSINTDTIEQYDGATGNSVASFITAQSGGLSKPRGLAFGYTDPSSLLYNPPAPPAPAGGHAQHGPGHPSVLASGAAELVSRNEPNAATSGDDVFAPMTRAAGQNHASASSVIMLEQGASIVSSLAHGNAASFLSTIHAATNGLSPSSGPLSSRLVDLLAWNIVEG
jgi:hypothetical protein